MKKMYIKPDTETVNVRLFSSVLDDISHGNWSQGAGGGDDPGIADAKENSLLWDNDLWDDDSDNNADSYDIWKE